MNDTKSPCATVLEAAKMSGMHTGMVVTSRITDATPASFSSHVAFRSYQSEIASQQIGNNPFGRMVDLMFGGGRCSFIPSTAEDSCRTDNRDLEREAKDKNGFKTVINTRDGFDKLSGDPTDLPLMGLFRPGHMSFEIDRDPSVEPSLREMTAKALEYLTKATETSDNGFFLLVEGSRIDMAAHNNDPAAHAHDILQYQEVIAFVKNYVETHPGTVMISVSDHETGGLSLGRQLSSDYPPYQWFPGVVARVRNSTEILSNLILTTPKNERAEFLRNVIFPVLMGIEDYTEEDIMYLSNPNRQDLEIIIYLGDMISRRAWISWASHGHSGVDVNLYAYAGRSQGSAIEGLRGSHENTDLGKFMRSYLNLNDMLVERLSQSLMEAVTNGTLILEPEDEAIVESTKVKEHAKPDEIFHAEALRRSG